MAGKGFRRLGIGAMMLLVLDGLANAGVAGAVTLNDLRDGGFVSIYGDYAPGGKCQGEPRLTIDETGFTFHVGGHTQHSTSFEYAVSFFGPDYQGISHVFFPFPIDAYEPGHVLMYANLDEISGRLGFEENLGPGETLTPMERDLVRSSPWERCSGAGR